ncbi:MAG: MFS transporter [Spirochaetales bacterium]|nr:MFS transporter [Spirochaetales bacterium]MCF7938961.1 MFS transporter [Spirochaetales bacterium]
MKGKPPVSGSPAAEEQRAVDNDSIHLDQWFARNTFGISAVEFFWGLGLPLVIESTFLQVFLRNLGASSTVVGLVPTIFFTGFTLASIFSGYLTGHLVRKRRAVILTHTLSAVSLALYGIILRLTGYSDATIGVFFIFYAWFCLGAGLIVPIWQNYLVKIFSRSRRFRALSMMMLVQNSTKLLSSFVILKIIERYAFSLSASSWIFTGTGFLLFGGSFFFLLTREKEDQPEGGLREGNVFRHLKESIRQVLKRRNLLRFLASDAETFAVVGMLSFYANYAVEYRGISEEFATGLLFMAAAGGNSIVQVFFGWLGLLDMKGKLIAAKIAALLGAGILCSAPGLGGFLAAAGLLGAARGIRQLSYAPVIKHLSGKKDATDFFAVAALFMVPASLGIPLANGNFLDAYSGGGDTAYRLVFAAMAVIIGIAFFFLLKTDFGEENDSY